MILGAVPHCAQHHRSSPDRLHEEEEAQECKLGSEYSKRWLRCPGPRQSIVFYFQAIYWVHIMFLLKARFAATDVLEMWVENPNMKQV